MALIFEMNRRGFLKSAVAASLLVGSRRVFGQSAAAKIKIVLNYGVGLWYFDPVGLYLEKGQSVEWQALRWGPTVSAFHPSIGNHELRIPEAAKPFDSELLAEGDTFRWTFEVEGTYDYFSKNHEAMGLIGRIVVGRPGGPGEKPPRYGGAEGRAPIYPRAMDVFGIFKSEEIVQRKAVPFPAKKIGHRYPEY